MTWHPDIPHEYRNQIVTGDARVLAERIPTSGIDVLITDPPYGVSIDTSWLTALHVQRGKPPNKSDDLLIGDDGQLDLTWLFDYQNWVVFGFPHIKSDLATGYGIWDKWPGNMNGGGIGNPCEMYITNCFNGFEVHRVLWAGYYRASGETRYKHPTQKPLMLMRQIVEKVSKPGDVILDPFCGSGSTLVACKLLNRRFIGFDIVPRYTELARERVRNTQPPLPLKYHEQLELLPGD